MSSTVQATQSLTVNNATTVSTLVQSLNNLVGNNTAACSSQQSNLAYVAPGISTEVPSTVMSALPKAIVIGNNQPLILPKPNMQKTIMPSTPPKVAYISSHSLLNSPIHGHASPGQTLLVTSPFQRKRPFGDNDTEATDSKKRRTPSRCASEKTGKGLRHFSMKVCEKVQLKGVTTYNEVADELVQDFAESSKNADGTEHTYDQKNIRRRVYDALNVLKAMNIITNEKKEIRWVGLPTNSAQECRQLEEQKAERTERIQQKMQQLKELLVQQIAFKNLVERNKQAEKKNGPPPQNACIDLPFIIVNTSKKTVIDCSISNDKAEYLFNFNEAFEIHDDIEVLKRMGLSFGLDKGECTPKNLIAARKMVPRSLEPYVQQMADGTFGHVEIIDRNSILTVPLDTINSRQCTSRSKDQLLSSYKSTTSSRRTFPTISDDSENDAEDERSIAE